MFCFYYPDHKNENVVEKVIVVLAVVLVVFFRRLNQMLTIVGEHQKLIQRL